MDKKSFSFAVSLCAIIFCAVSCGGGQEAVSVYGLTVEQLDNPLAVGTLHPRFGWKIGYAGKDVYQKTYRITAASSEEKLLAGEADLWDSGTILSEESLYIPYRGKGLNSRDKVFWRVSVETTKGKAESGVGVFSVGLFDSCDSLDCGTRGGYSPACSSSECSSREGVCRGDWKASWIGCKSGEDRLDGRTKVPARYLRKEFTLGDKIREARLYICGLGLYEAFVNGSKIGDDTMKPTLSDYRKTVYYNTYDITEHLSRGQNAIGVVLGNGRYVSMRINPVEKVPIPPILHYGLPVLLLQAEITLADGSVETITSDDSWKITADGPVRANNEFDGEFYDAGKELGAWTEPGYDSSLWTSAQLMPAPGGRLVSQPNPNIKVQETIRPVSITDKGDAYILDMGQNMVGRLRITAKGDKGDTLSMRFAETLQEDGSLYSTNLRSAEAEDTYVFARRGKISWQPLFVYHGFRYVEIKGLSSKPKLSDFEGQILYDEMPVTGTFETSDPVINQVYANAYRGIRGNYRSMPTDCPQRDERMGWLGDRTTGCYGESLIFSNHLLYSKWLQDIEESQDEAGSIPDVAPVYWHIRTDNMTWPAAFLTASDMVYKRFGDSGPILRHYPAMKKWLLYMKDRYMKDGIMTKDTYGDWCLPPESPELIHSADPARITDPQLISTASYYRLAGLMAEFASVAGHREDAEWFLQEARSTKTVFNDTYFNAKDSCYSNNTVTANILPLHFGMVPEGFEKAVFRHIADKTINDLDTHVSVGVIGIQQLMRCLTEYGRPDIAFKLASDNTYPSWGYMAARGATTIWELWNGDTADPSMNSGNHVMLLGDLLLWEYEYLAGIRPVKPGYKSFEIKPHPVAGLSHVDCSYDSVYGRIASKWRREGDTFVMDFTVPANTRAKVFIPGNPDRKTVEAAGGHYYDTRGGYGIYDFPSGSYSVSSVIP